MIDRRAFLSRSLATVALLAAPRAGFPQQRLPRVALVSPIVPVEAMTETGISGWRDMLSELRRLGLVEGQNVAFERYSGMGQIPRYERLGAAVAATRPDVIFVCCDTIITRAAASADPAVPVVFMVTDALASGLVSNLARPGGNLTGVNVTGGIAIEGKRMALLSEAVPAAKRIAYLISQTGWDAGSGADALVGGPEGSPAERGHRTGHTRVAREAAHKLGLSLVPMPVNDPSNVAALRSAFAAIAERGAQALQIAFSNANSFAIASITALTVAARLPGIAENAAFAAGGGLMAYGVTQARCGVALPDTSSAY